MKERIKRISVDKEDVFCPKCKSVDIDFDYLKCEHCGYALGTEDVMEKIDIVEVQEYGFWLRFMSEHFIPCEKCQEELSNIFEKVEEQLDFNNPNCVSLHFWKNYEQNQVECSFTLSFVSPTPTSSYEYKPCKKCQKKILKKFSEKELHIGNDSKPLIELWRKWDINDRKTELLQKREEHRKKVLGK